MTEKILLTIPNFRTAGSQYVLLSLYKLYKQQHPETFVLIEDASGLFPEEIAHQDRLVIPKKGYLHFWEGVSYTWKLAKMIRLNGITVMHSWDYRSELWEAFACRLAGIPYVYTKKNNAWSGKWKLKSFLACHIAYDHPDMGKRFFNAGILRNKSSLILHGIDPERFKPASAIKRRSFVIGCIGNIGVNKNQLAVLKALAHSKLNIKCHFYGNADSEYLKLLQEFIDSNNMKEQVVFNGFVENTKLPEILNGFDILVLASYNEGLPVILLEALACGVYCLASDSGGGSDYIIKQCGNGKIFDPDNYTQLSGLIHEFYSRPERETSVSENAINSIREHFSIQKEAESYLSLFSQL